MLTLLLALQVDDVSAERLKAAVERLVAFGTRHTLSDPKDEKRGIGAARAWIKAEFEAIAKDARSEMTVELHDWTLKDVKCCNVAALLKGKRDPKRVVVFGAHYDSRTADRNDAAADAPGANDDGSGTAAVLEAARVLSKHEHDASILFVCFAGEEQGLHGSAAFARDLKKRDLEVVAMINNDIIGNKDQPKSARVFSNKASRGFARLIRHLGADLDVEVQDAEDRKGRGGDHQSFTREGFIAARLMEAVETLDRQHNGNDTIDGVDFDYAAKIAKIDVRVLANLASAPPAPTGVVVKDGKATWTPVEGAASYLVFFENGGSAVAKEPT